MRKTINIYLFIFFLSIYTNVFGIDNKSNLVLKNNTNSNKQNIATDFEEDFYDLDYELEELNTNSVSKVWDPFEKMNRKVFIFNDFFLTYVGKPFNENIYSKVTTKGVRKSIHNVIANLKMPMVFLNYVLQLDLKNSAKSLYSFSINSTFGVFGIFDIATHQGVTPSATSFGMTLAKYHIPAGPYLVLPFLGPTNSRGLVGTTTEIVFDPLGYNVLSVGGKRPLIDDEFLIVRTILYGVDANDYAVSNFYDVMKSSFDPYITVRDAFGQSQAYKIKQLKEK